MPTNKLWLEHTEKAAWESVQALREKLADAERRIERLAPPVAAWQSLLDELDRARAELGLQNENYAEVLRRLLERAVRQNERLLELERERARRTQQSEQAFDVIALTRGLGHESFDDDDESEPQGRRVSQIDRAVQRRRRELVADQALPDDVDALLSSIDARVADLGDVEGKALSDAAVDLGVLALALAALRQDDD
jgi:chromosome segregation ATPase